MSPDTADEADESWRGVEVAAATAKEVRQRKCGGRCGMQEDDGNEHFPPLDQQNELAEELREGFAGEPAVRPRRGHEGKNQRGQSNGATQHERDNKRRAMAHELIAAMAMMPKPPMFPMVSQTLSVFSSSAEAMEESQPPTAL